MDDTIAIFKNPLSIRAQIAQLSTEGLIYFSGLLGIYSFFLNITPLTHTVGNHVLTLVYESLTNDKMLAYKMQKINTALDVLSLCFFLWFVYKFFF